MLELPVASENVDFLSYHSDLHLKPSDCMVVYMRGNASFFGTAAWTLPYINLPTAFVNNGRIRFIDSIKLCLLIGSRLVVSEQPFFRLMCVCAGHFVLLQTSCGLYSKCLTFFLHPNCVLSV
jgi:hypothetical protein